MTQAALQGQALAEILQKLQLAFFGGKGGVGKTTLAAACALQEAQTNPQKRIALLSADPAHSLASLLSDGRQEADQLSTIKAGSSNSLFSRSWSLKDSPNLTVFELDFKALTEAFEDIYGRVIETIAEENTLLSRDEIGSFVGISLPSFGEIMSLLSICDLLQAGTFDLVVLDTAPTGHTLRVLNLPSALDSLTEALTLMESRHDTIMSALVGASSTSPGSDRLTRLKESAGLMTETLKDSHRCGVFVVTIAEHLPLKETERFIADLKTLSIAVKAILINHTAAGNCPFCLQQAAGQRQYIANIQEGFPATPTYLVGQQACAPADLRRLKQLAESIEIVPRDRLIQLEAKNIHCPPALASNPKATGHLPDFASAGQKFLIFAGKGGVGKTSIAAASALAFSLRHADKQILIASIDPAHSLGDCLGRPLSNKPLCLQDNLWALEINACELLAEFKSTYEEETANLLAGLFQTAGHGGGFEMRQDREIADKLVNLDTPDLDEFMVFRRLAELRRSGKFDLVIIDPAPSGHFFRFLQLPAIAVPWIKATLKVIKEHRALATAPKTVRELLTLIKDIQTFQQEVSEPACTAMVAVASPNRLVLEGTADMVLRLQALTSPLKDMVINLMRPPSPGCSICMGLQDSEQKALASFAPCFRDLNVVKVSLSPHEIAGPDGLIDLGGELYG